MSNKLLKKHYNGHGLYRVLPDPRYLTLQSDGHGIISADALSGYSGDTITLSNTAHDGYLFSGYSVTGASLNGSTVTLNNQDATAKAWFSAKPVSSLYYSNAGNYIDKDIKGRTFTINKDITGHRYLTFKFNYMNDNNAGFNVRYSINSLKLSAQDLAFSSYSSYPDYSKPSTREWPIFYYNTNVDCGTFTRNSTYTNTDYERAGSTIIAATYYISGAELNAPIKYVIDRNTRNFSAYRNSNFLGNGTLSENANINHVDNFIFTADNYLNYRIMSATNIRLAGFDQWTAATAYNG